MTLEDLEGYILKTFGKLLDAVDIVAQVFCIILIALLATSTFGNLVLRGVFGYNYVGTYDWIQIILMWSIFIGAAAVFRSKGHIRYDIVISKARGTMALILNTVINLCCISFFLYLVVSGRELLPIVFKQEMPASGMMSGWLYVPVVVSAVIMILYAVESIGNDCIKYLKLDRKNL